LDKLRGNPEATAPSAIASTTKAIYAGPEDVKARKASSCLSGNSKISLIGSKIFLTAIFWSKVISSPHDKPVRPSPTREGVLGTALTHVCPGKVFLRLFKVIPAKTEINNGLGN